MLYFSGLSNKSCYCRLDLVYCSVSVEEGIEAGETKGAEKGKDHQEKPEDTGGQAILQGDIKRGGEKKKLKIKSPKGKRVPFIDIISLETYLLLPHLLTWQASLVTFPRLPPPSWLPRPVTFPVTRLLTVAGLSP